MYPLWTPALLRFNQAILVSRHDPASRRRVVEEVRRRATSGGKWPQVGKGLQISPSVCFQRGFCSLGWFSSACPISFWPLGVFPRYYSFLRAPVPTRRPCLNSNQVNKTTLGRKAIGKRSPGFGEGLRKNPEGGGRVGGETEPLADTRSHRDNCK